MAAAYVADVNQNKPIENDDFDIPKNKGVIDIGLIGEAGSGRTSFVRATMRYHYGARKEKLEDKIEPTFLRVSYPHPREPERIKLWDLPGVGIAEYPDTKTYFEKLGLGKKNYDAYLLFNKGKVSIESQRLAVRLQAATKPFVIVKTFIDFDAKNDEMVNYDKEETLEKVKKNISDSFNGLIPRRVFPISNVKIKEWEFSRLYEEIADDEFMKCEFSECLLTPSWLNAMLEKLMIKEKHEIYKADKAKLIKFLKQNMPDVKHIKKKGLAHAQKLMEEKLDEYKKEHIQIAVIGRPGAGKSNFINTIRGLKNANDRSGGIEPAISGSTESTDKTAKYHFPGNPNILLWDCPGLGSPKIPTVDAYTRAIVIKRFDAFIIMSSDKFSNLEKSLVSKIKSLEKPFFFVRSKIDVASSSASLDKLPFGGKELEKIKDDCVKNLQIEEKEKTNIFLISNKYAYRKDWDFPRLCAAIEKRLPAKKRECFLFSMLTFSKDILKDKVDALKDEVKFVAFFRSIIVKLFTTEKYSQEKDLDVIAEYVESYTERLGFPKEDSEEFKRLTPELRNKVQPLFSKEKVRLWLRKIARVHDDEEAAEATGEDSDDDDEERFPSWLNINEANEKPYKFVYRTLRRVLDEMKIIAEEILDVDSAKLNSDFQ